MLSAMETTPPRLSIPELNNEGGTELKSIPALSPNIQTEFWFCATAFAVSSKKTINFFIPKNFKSGTPLKAMQLVRLVFSYHLIY